MPSFLMEAQSSPRHNRGFPNATALKSFFYFLFFVVSSHIAVRASLQGAWSHETPLLPLQVRGTYLTLAHRASTAPAYVDRLLHPVDTAYPPTLYSKCKFSAKNYSISSLNASIRLSFNGVLRNTHSQCSVKKHKHCTVVGFEPGTTVVRGLKIAH